MTSTSDAFADELPREERGDVVALAFFSAWTVIGLFVDGWAHNVDKPETFFTPWHFVLYSGFVCGVAFFMLREIVFRRPTALTDRWINLGVIGFVAGAVGDGIWHGAFGIEEDVEALLSPTHLLLMASGIVIVGAPARAWIGRRAGSLGSFAPVAVSVGLMLAVAAFFLQFASTQRVFDEWIFAGGMDDELRTVGVNAILITNALVLGFLAWTLRRWTRTPPGTFTIVLGLPAFLLSVLEGFDQVLLAVPLAGAGVLADLLVSRRLSPIATLGVVPLLLWPAWFLAYDIHADLGWEAELWTGSTVLAVLTGVGFGFLVTSTSATPERETTPA